MWDFNDKVVVITGATSGIGRALALNIASSNVHLVLAARRMDELTSVANECAQKGAICTPLFVDMASPAAIDSFVDAIKIKYKKLDILINNAGISQRSHAESTPIEVDRQIMEVNFFGQVALTKALWPLLIEAEKANIVLISSVVGSFGFPQRSAYSASKHALEGFFESWMMEKTNENVHFTTVAPGRINTNISYSALKADGSPHQLLDKGQENGISPEKCAVKIINGFTRNKRKVYIAKQELILVALRKCVPFLFFKLVKKLKLI
jgi:short-subunit dehydrogenase